MAMDNVRLILYLSLGLVAFLLWERWQQWQTPAPPEPPPVASSEAASKAGRPASEPSPPAEDDLPEAVVATPRAGDAPAAVPRRAAGRRVRVRTDTLDLEIDGRGGDVRSLKLRKMPVSLETPDEPFALFGETGDPGDLHVVQSGLLHDRINGMSAAEGKRRAPSHHADYRLEASEYTLGDDEDELRVVLRWRNDDGIAADKIYTFRRGSYLVDVEHVVHNRGDQAWVGRQYRQLRHGAIPEEGLRLLYTFTGAAWYDGKYNKLPFDELAEQPFVRRVRDGWVAMLQHYFVGALLADGENDFYTRVARGENGSEYIIGIRSEPLVVEPGASGRFRARLYAGPKLQNHLEETAEGLELTTDYGIFTFLSKPLFWLLDKINNLIGSGGVGFSLV